MLLNERFAKRPVERGTREPRFDIRPRGGCEHHLARPPATPRGARARGDRGGRVRTTSTRLRPRDSSASTALHASLPSRAPNSRQVIVRRILGRQDRRASTSPRPARCERRRASTIAPVAKHHSLQTARPGRTALTPRLDRTRGRDRCQPSAGEDLGRASQAKSDIAAAGARPRRLTASTVFCQRSRSSPRIVSVPAQLFDARLLRSNPATSTQNVRRELLGLVLELAIVQRPRRDSRQNAVTPAAHDSRLSRARSRRSVPAQRNSTCDRYPISADQRQHRIEHGLRSWHRSRPPSPTSRTAMIGLGIGKEVKSTQPPSTLRSRWEVPRDAQASDSRDHLAAGNSTRSASCRLARPVDSQAALRTFLQSAAR